MVVLIDLNQDPDKGQNIKSLSVTFSSSVQSTSLIFNLIKIEFIIIIVVIIITYWLLVPI